MLSKDQKRLRAGTKGSEPAGATISQDIELTETARLSAAAQTAIGRKLRFVYDEVVHQPLPHGILNLLKKLEHKEREE